MLQAPAFLFADVSGNVRELAQPEAGRSDVRMNDGACDPQGRFWAGTMAHDESPGAGVLYRLELDGRCTTVRAALTSSNGIGWSPDGTAMYLSDSGTGTIERFDFDGAIGDIVGRRVIVEIAEPGVAPDGLTVDAEGGIWVALWDGGAVRCYTSEGSLVATVPVPVDRPTSCAFGGPDLTTLFITTARHGLGETALARQPMLGACFASTGSASAARRAHAIGGRSRWRESRREGAGARWGSRGHHRPAPIRNAYRVVRGRCGVPRCRLARQRRPSSCRRDRHRDRARIRQGRRRSPEQPAPSSRRGRQRDQHALCPVHVSRVGSPPRTQYSAPGGGSRTSSSPPAASPTPSTAGWD